MSNYYLYVHITPNNKYYIGITKVKPINRWKNGKGYSNSPYFYNAIQKYGWDNIKHIVLLENLSKEVACECEKYLIAKYKTNSHDYGYNVCSGGEGTNGYHHTEEYKDRLRHRPISNSQKQDIAETVRKRWKEGAYVNRKHTQIPWNKGLTKDDPRVAKSVRKVGEFHHTEEAKLKMSKSHKGKPAHNRKRVLCVETDVIYESVSEATKQTGINNISKSARKNSIAGGFHWRYIEDDNI